MKKEFIKLWKDYLEWVDKAWFDGLESYDTDSLFDFMDWLIKYSNDE